MLDNVAFKPFIVLELNVTKMEKVKDIYEDYNLATAFFSRACKVDCKMNLKIFPFSHSPF